MTPEEFAALGNACKKIVAALEVKSPD